MKTPLLVSAVLLCCSFGAYASDPAGAGEPSDGKTLYLEWRILHDGELIGAPKLLVRSGEMFKVVIGVEGKDSFRLEGSAKLGDAEQATTEFTYENTHWAGPVKQTRRITQAIRTAMGKDAMVEIPGADGSSDVLMFKVSQPDANTLKFRAQ